MHSSYAIYGDSGSYLGIFFIQAIQKDMRMTYFMDGSINGNKFTIEGEGTGKPYE